MNVPPQDPNTPPPTSPYPYETGSAAYYRPGADGSPAYGSADKLQALSDGYFGLNPIFGLNVLFALGSNVMIRTASPDNVAMIAIGVIVVMFVSILFLTLPKNKQTAYGKGWSDSNAILASVLMGLNSALCCGVIGYIVMQNIALTEIKRYGIKGGSFFGLKEKDVEAHIAAMRTAPRGVQPPTFGV
ncbi:MAG: hypothetical protein ABL949_07450 [Fimbriimonadaceae bacterium]